MRAGETLPLTCRVISHYSLAHGYRRHEDDAARHARGRRGGMPFLSHRICRARHLGVAPRLNRPGDFL